MFDGLNNEMLTEAEVLIAIQNAMPQKPTRHELGGGYYFTCHWIKCNNTIHRWQEYCDQCGQKIDWEDD